MSRAATLVYEETAPARPASARHESVSYRVLGCHEMRLPAVVNNPGREPGMAALFVDNLEAFDVAMPAAAARPRGAPRLRLALRAHWLAGMAVVSLALLVVTPVLANGLGGAQPRHFTFSGYNDPAGTQSAPVFEQASGTEAAPVSAPAPPASGGYDLQGPPSISVAQIEAVLRQYGSPASGLGQSLYDLGVKYGIDPAYALAFFVHESACGTRGVARFTKSLGNIRWSDGYASYEGYRSYDTWQSGFEDWYKLITDLYINGWGLRTVDDIVPVYAPSEDSNDPAGYIASVKYLVDSWRGK